MMWPVICVGYEVRAPFAERKNKAGESYYLARVENPDGYTDTLMTHSARVLDIGLQRGDIIAFTAIASFGKYPRLSLRDDACIARMPADSGGDVAESMMLHALESVADGGEVISLDA